MTWPDRITVYHKLRPLPADPAAFDLDVIILSELHQRPAARCAESLVVYDYRLGQKAAMPSFMRDVFEETLRLQDAAKTECGRRVQSLLERVETLERESWNREGAKEDMGSAVT
jgi:Thioesterase-like superfamily